MGLGSRNPFQEPSLELHRLAGRYDDPMPTRFLAPLAGLKFRTPRARICKRLRSPGTDSKESIPGLSWAPKFYKFGLLYRALPTIDQTDDGYFVFVALSNGVGLS